MKAATTLYRAHQCSKCPGDTEYYCVSCPCELCPQCKESHVQDLQTIDHDVVSHRDKINYIPTQEICVRHPRNVYKKYCQTCEHPVCYHCRKHRNHTQLDVREPFQTKRQQHLRTIHTIRCESLFYRHVLLTGTKSDVKICHTKFIHFQQNLKDLIKKVKHDLMYNVFCNFDFKHRCTIQKIEMSRHIVSLQTYEHIYEQSEIRPLQFLSSIKTTLPKIHLTLHTGQLSVTESLNKEDIVESLSEIKTADRGKRRLQTECLLKLMSGAEFHQSLTLTGVDGCSQMYVKGCLHMSIATPNHVWVSDSGCNLVLTDTTGVPLHCVKGPCSDISFGIHTVNSESELIHIDKNYNINILSKDGKTITTYIERTDSTWEPRCVYWSPSTGDLLVGMYREITEYTGTGKVARYNQSGQLIQTIEHNNKGLDWYRYPIYITENNNGDIVVSDSDYLLESGSVVVTEREGKHRFSYTGHPSESRLRPFGICTDALSHILVCDGRTHTVQMLNRDGNFLSHLLIRPPGVFSPHSLGYDVNTHRLWVGSWGNNNVVVYRYIERQDASTGK
uniref:Brain tumor protein n=1 Tax=Magallana gigas TaxID=29159 RepID=K1RIX9_MAGGI